MEEDRDGAAAAPAATGPDASPVAGRPEPRVETAVAPIIQAEPVHIPTPAWGALSAVELAAASADLTAPAEPGAEDLEAAHRRGAWPGWTAFLLAVATAVVHGVAVVTEAAKDYETATILAWVAIGLSAGAVVGGIVAAILRRGRGPGIAAAVVGAIANPWLLLQVLTVLQG